MMHYLSHDLRVQELAEIYHVLKPGGRLNGGDIGASFAATIDGKFVVDIWAGYADAGRTRPWSRDTLACLYSTTKAITALCALVLVDRGQLDLDAPVAEYWPEFAQAGKQDIPVKYLLSHQAGCRDSIWQWIR